MATTTTDFASYFLRITPRLTKETNSLFETLMAESQSIIEGIELADIPEDFQI